MCSMPLYIKTNPWVYPSQAKVKFCVVYLKTVFISTKSRFSRASFAYPSCFYFFSPLVFLPLALHTLHSFTLDLESFHPSGISLLPGQWFLPVSLAMLSITGLLLSSLGELNRRCVHTSNKK